MADSGAEPTEKNMLRKLANMVTRKQRKVNTTKANTDRHDLQWEMSTAAALQVSTLGSKKENASSTSGKAGNQAKNVSQVKTENSSAGQKRVRSSTMKTKPAASIPTLSQDVQSNSSSAESQFTIAPKSAWETEDKPADSNMPAAGKNEKPTIRPVVYGRPDENEATTLHQSVLLVEPNPKLQAVMSELLDKIGVVALVASSAKEAFMILGQYRPSVAIIDAELPDMPGIKLIATIRDNTWGEAMPVIMMASNDEHLHEGSAAWLDIADYLYKPFNIHALQTVLKEYVQVDEFPSTVEFRGAIGLVMDDANQRIRMRRFLVRNGYAVAVSCGPDSTDSCLFYQGAMDIDSWLVQVKDENRCLKVLDELDDYFDVPVLTGFDQMPHPKSDTRHLQKWQRTILEKLKSSVKDVSGNNKGFVAA